MTWKYHGKSLELIGAKPQVSPVALQELSEVERRVGRPLPESVKEWYSLQNACQLLEQYSNEDPAIPRPELGRRGASEYLVFRFENQGVCRWAVRLDAGDDPAVFVDHECEDSDYNWMPCTDHFSDYVYCCVWDYGTVFRQGSPLIQAQNMPLSDEALALLSQEFARVLDSRGWPADRQYRFQRPGQRILIWSGSRQADWWLAAENSDSLAALARSVWQCDRVGKSLWSNDDEGMAILKSIDARSGRWPPKSE